MWCSCHSGTLNCVHSKSPSASTFHEVQNRRDYELIKPPSKDKRWAIRESSAKVSRLYLLSPVREVHDEQWGPNWNELLTLEPAPAVVMDKDAVDPAQQKYFQLKPHRGKTVCLLTLLPSILHLYIFRSACQR